MFSRLMTKKTQTETETVIVTFFIFICALFIFCIAAYLFLITRQSLRKTNATLSSFPPSLRWIKRPNRQ